MGKWIREYSHYPKFLPLCIYTDHGPMTLGIMKQELESGAPYQFYHSPSLVKKWKEITKKEAFVLYSPYIYCRKRLGISRSANAKGTIAFPAHSTVDIDDILDIEVYIKQLLMLPREFQPISVCLYYSDIKKNQHKIFQKYNIPVYTAGYYFDERFAERLYNILKNFKYATSNVAGSYLYYAVEMGIPFSIFGQKQKLFNKSDPNLDKGEFDPYKLSALHRKVHKMFSGLQTKITSEQKEFIEINLGLKDGVKPSQLRHILFKALFKWLFSFRVFSLVAKLLRKLVKVSLLQKQQD